jgi:hypothetical protein
MIIKHTKIKGFNVNLDAYTPDAQVMAEPTVSPCSPDCGAGCCNTAPTPKTKDDSMVVEDAAFAALRHLYPHGHPDFLPACLEEIKLHSRKNHDYAAGGDALGNFKRVAAILEMYPGLDLAHPAIVALVYAMKQVDATLWMLSNGHEAQVEGIRDRLQDVSVYAKLARIMIEKV